MALNPHSSFEIETKMFGGGSQFLDINLPDRRRIMKIIGRYSNTPSFEFANFRHPPQHNITISGISLLGMLS